jgi:putative phosphoribosyl transferase
MDNEKYQNRQEAGRRLARQLTSYAHRENVLVLALPRGGVPVAYEIARALQAPLDVFIVRKLGVPGHEELAFGALAAQGQYVLNEEIVQHLHLSSATIQAVIAQEQEELQRRERVYRGRRTLPLIADQTVILVDDGIATGATMRVAIQALRRWKPMQIVVAVPVAERTVCQDLQQVADQFVCPIRPSHLVAVGNWYDDFTQTTDEEVQTLLAKGCQ